MSHCIASLSALQSPRGWDKQQWKEEKWRNMTEDTIPGRQRWTSSHSCLIVYTVHVHCTINISVFWNSVFFLLTGQLWVPENPLYKLDFKKLYDTSGSETWTYMIRRCFHELVSRWEQLIYAASSRKSQLGGILTEVVKASRFVQGGELVTHCCGEN